MIAPKKNLESNSRAGRGWAWAGVVGLGALGLLVWWLQRDGGGASEPPVDATGRLIAEVRHDKTESVQLKEGTASDGSGVAETAGTNALPPGAYRDAGGVLRKPGGMRIVEGPVIEGRLPEGFNKGTFGTPVENEIAAILRLPPGAVRFGGARRWSPRFEQDLRDSMALGDQITDEDSPRERELKRQVWETKKDLVARMDEGESLKDILEEAQREMKRLATYRQSLLRELDGILTKDEMSDQDVKDFVTAANAILEDNGMEKISERMTFARRNAFLRRKHHQKEEAK